MQWADVSSPSLKTLRQFAWLWAVVFAALTCWQGFKNGNRGIALALAGLAVSVGPLGLWKPRAVRPVYVGWMVLAFPLGWVVSRLLLAAIFYGVFTPLGLWFRLMSRDVLRRRPRPGQSSYWSPRAMPNDLRSYFRQF
jgi:hypothetical protein